MTLTPSLTDGFANPNEAAEWTAADKNTIDMSNRGIVPPDLWMALATTTTMTPL